MPVAKYRHPCTPQRRGAVKISAIIAVAAIKMTTTMRNRCQSAGDASSAGRYFSLWEWRVEMIVKMTIFARREKMREARAISPPSKYATKCCAAGFFAAGSARTGAHSYPALYQVRVA